jgi:hypothetical protein
MEFKGTKGKWEIYWNIQYPDILISTDEVDIATVDSWDHDTTYEEESKANALLISKAPEMLKMLNKTLSNLESIMKLMILFKHDKKGTDFKIISKLIKEHKKLIKEAIEL